MAEQIPSNLPLPLPRLAASLVAACLAGFAGVAGLPMVQNGVVDAATVTAALAGAASVLGAGIAGLMLLKVFAAQGAKQMAFGALACSGTRLIGSVFIALGLLVMAGLERRPLWFAVLVAGGLALVFEAVIINRWLARPAPANS